MRMQAFAPNASDVQLKLFNAIAWKFYHDTDWRIRVFGILTYDLSGKVRPLIERFFGPEPMGTSPAATVPGL